MVMQHSEVGSPSESRAAESTKEKANSSYILLSSHPAHQRLQLGGGGGCECMEGVGGAIKFTSQQLDKPRQSSGRKQIPI